MGCIIATGKHEPMENLSYLKSVSFKQLCTGTNDSRGITRHLDQSGLLDLELLHQLKHSVSRHDLGETGALSSLPFHFAEQEGVGLLVVDGPGLSAAMWSRFVHQDLGQLDL